MVFIAWKFYSQSINLNKKGYNTCAFEQAKKNSSVKLQDKGRGEFNY